MSQPGFNNAASGIRPVKRADLHNIFIRTPRHLRLRQGYGGRVRANPNPESFGLPPALVAALLVAWGGRLSVVFLDIYLFALEEVVVALAELADFVGL